ncbi:MAG: O-antigen ligase family protein [Candidatus Helarchaeota archaeon]
MEIIRNKRYKWLQDGLIFIFIIVNAQLITSGHWTTSLFTLLFLIFILLCYKYPSYVFVFWMFFYPISHNFFSISLGKFPDITFTRVVIITLFIFEFMKYLFLNEEFIHRSQKKIFLLWIFYALLVLINSFRPDLVDQTQSLQIAIDAVVIPVIVFFLGMKYFTDSNIFRLFFRIIPIVGVVCALLAIIEYFTRFDIFPSGGGLRETRYFVRADGPFFSGETLSAFLIYIIIFTFGSIILSKSLPTKMIYSLFIIIIEAGVLSTLMRLNIGISLFSIILLTWIFGSRRMRIILIIFIIFFTGMIVSIRDEITKSAVYQERFTDVKSVESRLSAYKTGLQLVKDNFLFGVGYRNYPKVSLNYETRFRRAPAPPDPHNGLLLVIGQLGFIGLVLFIIIYSTIFMHLFTNKNTWYGKLYMVALISYFLMNTTAAFIDNSDVSLINLIFISLVFTKNNIYTEEFLNDKNTIKA